LPELPVQRFSKAAGQQPAALVMPLTQKNTLFRMEGDFVDHLLSVDLTARFDVLRKYLHREISTVWRKSVRSFIQAVVDRIAVDSGMSLASLKPLAAEVRFKSTLSAQLSGSGPRFRRRRYDSSAFPGVSEFKSQAHGEALGQRGKAYELSFGDPRNPEFNFQFEIVVLQFYLHEHGLAKPVSHSWGSLEAGQEAFLQTWEIELKKVLSQTQWERFVFEGIVP
jgi:hypothetical protein